MNERSIEFIRLTHGIDSPNRERCLTILARNHKRFLMAPGSSHNHQAWPGGYLDHITQAMTIATGLYPILSAGGALPFSLADGLLVIYLHDLEKPWRFNVTPEGIITKNPELDGKEAKERFRLAKIAEYSIVLTDAQADALKYVEGEGKDYDPDRRIMNELAGFCHACDVLSARVLHDRH